MSCVNGYRNFFFAIFDSYNKFLATFSKFLYFFGRFFDNFFFLFLSETHYEKCQQARYFLTFPLIYNCEVTSTLW